MSSEDDELLKSFLEESREHLENIEADLMDLEEAGEGFDGELVNKIFRPAHSIKGSAGFLGLVTISKLAHTLENVLHMIRERQVLPVPDVVNLLLRGYDLLASLIDNHNESENIDISQTVAELTNIFPGNTKESSEKTVDIDSPGGISLFEEDELSIEQARRGGKFIYIVEYDLIHDVHEKEKTPLDVITEMQKTGLILNCKVDISTVGTLKDGFSKKIPFYVLFATIIDPDVISALFQLEQSRIHSIEKQIKDVGLAGEETSSGPVPVRTEPVTLDLSREPDWLEEVKGFAVRGYGGVGVLALNPDAVVDNARDLQSALLFSLEKFECLKLDMSGVEEMDLSFLQVLRSAHKTFESRGKILESMAAPPETVSRFATSMGLREEAMGFLS